jgi:hypothetical protein
MGNQSGVPETLVFEVFEDSKSTREPTDVVPVFPIDLEKPIHEGVDSASTYFTPQKSIFGHSLDDVSDIVQLSDAIDVVFYDGGNAQISGFELGTDLLWFFLSPEELATAKNSISQDGDLVLDFGDIGTLTFLNVLTETSTDYMSYV